MTQGPGPRVACGVRVADQSEPMRTLFVDKVSRLVPEPLYSAEVASVSGPQEILKTLLLAFPTT